MILFTGGCIGRVLRDYHTFQADRLLYESAGTNWETAWHDRLLWNVEWYIGIMVLLAIAWIIISIMWRRRRGTNPAGVSEDTKYGMVKGEKNEEEDNCIGSVALPDDHDAYCLWKGHAYR